MNSKERHGDVAFVGRPHKLSLFGVILNSMTSWKPLVVGGVLLGVATATVMVPFPGTPDQHAAQRQHPGDQGRAARGGDVTRA
jgi:hypothetical protein